MSTARATEQTLQQVRDAVGGGAAAPQADLATSGTAWVDAAVPDGTVRLEVWLDGAAYVVVDAAAVDPAEDGRRLMPNLNHAISCIGCTRVHLRRVGDSDVTMEWTAVRAAGG